MFTKEAASVSRFILVLWGGLVCPWYAVLCISYVIGFVAYMLHYHYLPKHLNPIGGSIFPPLYLVGCIFLGRGVFLGDTVAIRLARLLMVVGTCYFVLWIGLDVYLFFKINVKLSVFLLYLAKGISFIAVNGLCWNLLGKERAQS